jgi:hypothetical protein
MIIFLVSVFVLALIISAISLFILDNKNKPEQEPIELNNNKPHIHHSVYPTERWGKSNQYEKI